MTNTYKTAGKTAEVGYLATKQPIDRVHNFKAWEAERKPINYKVKIQGNKAVFEIAKNITFIRSVL